MNNKRQFIQPSPIAWMIGISTLILFICSGLRHELLNSTAFDLGIFDQAIYLISQGKEPISSYLEFHILGDHAAWIFYLLALFYKISPSVYWLFAVQAIALSTGALPTWYLANQAGLKKSQAIAIASMYLLYPLVFNINLFDFHPDVIAVPAFLLAILAARTSNIWLFCLSILLILSCKAVLSLTIVAMGIWLLFFEKRPLYGVIAIILGLSWFVIATKVIIPFFSRGLASVERHLGRYKYLGNSFSEAIKIFLSQPGIILIKIFSFDNLGYLILLIVPVIWGLSPQSITSLIPTIPSLAMNLLSEDLAQKDLMHQYSLPILPFLIVAVISTLSDNKAWFPNKRAIIIWSLITFVCLAKFTHFTGKYLESLDNWQAARQAMSLVKSQGGVYTTSQIAPHLSHRDLIKFTDVAFQNQDLNIFDYVLLNVRHPGVGSNQAFSTQLVNQLTNNPEFKLEYQKNDVYLFVKS